MSLAGILVLVGVQGALAPHLRLAGVTPDLPLAAVLVIGLRVGPARGMFLGVLTGAVLDLADGTHLGLFALAAGAAGWLAGEAMLRIDPGRVLLCWLVSTAAAVLYGCLVLAGALVLEHGAIFLPGALRHALAPAPYDAALATLGYWAVAWVPRPLRL